MKHKPFKQFVSLFCNLQNPKVAKISKTRSRTKVVFELDSKQLAMVLARMATHRFDNKVSQVYATTTKNYFGQRWSFACDARKVIQVDLARDARRPDTLTLINRN